MLTIRREQMNAFRLQMRKKFEDRMLPILREYFPGDCEVLGEAQTRKVIALGLDRAAAHGFDTKGDACDYICLMFTFGSYFDEDPLLPWVAEILEDRKYLEPSALMKKLYAEGADYSRRVAGVYGEYRTRALLRARDLSFESFSGTSTASLTQDMTSLLSALYPQKYHTLAEGSLERLTELGEASAGRHAMRTRQGVLLYIALMFMVSSHFDRDPVHPWAAAVLKDESLTDPSVKPRKLYEAAMLRVDQALTVDTPVEKA